MKSFRRLWAFLALLPLIGCGGGFPVQQLGTITSCPTDAEIYLLQEHATSGRSIGRTPTTVSLISERPYHWELKAVHPTYGSMIWGVHGGSNVDHFFQFSRPVSVTPLSHEVNTYISEEKNYVIGKNMTVPVGAEMIRVRKYHTREAEFAIPLRGVQFADSSGLAYSVVGDRYKVAGTAKLGGDQMYFVQVRSAHYSKDNEAPFVAVKKDGTFLNEISLYPYNRLLASSCFSPLPSGPIFEMKPIKDFSAFGGDGNYQILYSGASGDQLRLSYREFSSDDVARVAFYQELTYNRSDKKIRFRNIQIEVLSATNENITFVVVSD